MTVSVCTIARGRDAHLHNLIRGLADQSAPPAELIIAYMQDGSYDNLPTCPFPIRQCHVSGERLPLAAARNAAARQASAETLIFIDVDCIPLPNLVQAYQETMTNGRCLMGETRYLAQIDDTADQSPQKLWQLAEQHAARRFSKTLGPGNRRIPEATEFWSLSFALSAATFRRTGGFDEDFTGYGGEDTDFAKRLDAHAIDLWWTPQARAVHQWHVVQAPPLGQFHDIIRNAQLFRRKHGVWCMEYWLDQFEMHGLIRRDSEQIRILRLPSPDECKAAVRNGTVRFS